MLEIHLFSSLVPSSDVATVFFFRGLEKEEKKCKMSAPKAMIQNE